MQSFFSSQTYAQRRAILKAKVKSGIGLFLGNEEVGMNYRDNHLPFRQDSSFLYFFGLDQPDLMAIIDFDSGQEIIFGRELTMDDIVWTGPMPCLTELAAKVGVESVFGPEKLWSILSEAQERARKVHYLPPYRAVNCQKIVKYLGLSTAQVEKSASEELIRAVVALRSIKTPEEIAEMHKAVDISGQMHRNAMRATKPNVFEYQAVAKIKQAALEANTVTSYPVIFSVNGQTLHNHSHHNLMQAGQLALCDAGAESLMHYAGDITRTFPVSGKFTTQQAEIYEVVLTMLQTAVSKLRAGVTYKSIHLAANKVLLEGLKSLGLLQGDVAIMLAEGVQGLFMPHGLGHMIGLDVHDMEDLGESYVGYRPGMERSTQLGLKSLRLAKELEAGFTLTVEPGVYFIPELIEKWKAEHKFMEFINYEKLTPYQNFGGIRLEDNVLITADGHELIGSPIPLTLKEVETAMES